jgi:hypothetical protein
VRSDVWMMNLDKAVEDYAAASAALARAANEKDRDFARLWVRDGRGWLDFVMEQIRIELDKARRAMEATA